jgi:hypothetical protein
MSMNELLISLISLCSMTASGVSYYLRSLDRLTIGFFLISVYVAALLEPAKFVLAFTLLLVGFWCGIACHEYSHYIIFRVWLSADKLELNIIRAYVEIESPYEVPTWGIRIAAGMPYILLISLTSVYYLAIGVPNFPLDSTKSFIDLAIVGISIGLGAGVSPSDLLGMLYPSEYQEFADSNEGKSVKIALKTLGQSIKTSLS